jgi:hypothetical protein
MLSYNPIMIDVLFTSPLITRAQKHNKEEKMTDTSEIS